MKRFDCHCHIFNIVNVGLKAILEHFDSAEKHLQKINEEKSPIYDEHALLKSHHPVIDKIKKVAELIRLFKNDSIKILHMLDKHYDGKYSLFPLMFDGDYLLESVKDSDFTYIRSQLENKSDSNKNANTPFLLSKEIGESDREVVLNFLNEIIPPANNKNVLLAAKSGFIKQYEDIKKIQKEPKYKGRVFPFLGVDPRRKDIKSKYLKEVGKNKLFAGIKVYPPNGFSPMDEALVGDGSIFEFCNNHQIPIVSHCSYGGFATPAKKVKINGMIIPEGKKLPKEFSGVYNFKLGIGDGFSEMVLERARVLNNPLIWEEVLKKYNNLTLVLAHFGSGNYEWQANILRMMKKYPNLYTDVSCMSNPETLKSVKAIYDANPDIRDKLLYGSDYFLDMFFNDSFDQYLERMKKAFGKTMFDKLSSENPKLFMQKWYI